MNSLPIPLSVRKRNHRVKTVASQSADRDTIHLQFQRTSQVASLRQSIPRVDRTLSRQGREAPIRTMERQISSSRRKSGLKGELTLHSQSQQIPVLSYYIATSGNNEGRIARLLDERSGWVRAPSRTSHVQLIWGNPLSQLQLGRGGMRPQHMVSRIPNSDSLTDKGRLYDSIAGYCEKRDIPLTFLPITFHLDRNMPARSLLNNINQFVDLFQYIADNTSLVNMWMLKPTNMNQGRDIHMFNNIERLRQLVMVLNSKNETLKDGLLEYIKKENSIVLQKYIESPLLIKGHKFDIRMWVLLDHLSNVYYYPQGYLRFSSQAYSLNHSQQDQLVHLTNHSLQKYGPNYQQSFNIQPISVLEEHTSGRNYQRFISRFKEIIVIAMNATVGSSSTSKSVKNMSNKYFELYGFDFMIDRQMNVRLIEANSNPAITEDSPLLAELVPKMLNETLKLTVDKVYNCHNPRKYRYGHLPVDNAWVLLTTLNH